MSKQKPIVAYLCVFEEDQGKSSRGIKAQRAAIQQLCQAEGFYIVSEYVEIESEKGFDALVRSPILKVALNVARQHKCPIVVAKLDRERVSCRIWDVD